MHVGDDRHPGGGRAGALYSVVAMRAHPYRLPLAVVAGLAAVGLATLLLRPRGALVEAAAVEATAYFSAEELERATEYRSAQRVLAIGGMAVSVATLAVLALRPPRPFRRFVRRLSGRPLVGGAAVGASVLVTLTVVGLPIDLLAHLRAVDAGLSTQSIGPWLADVGLSTLIGMGFAAAGGLLIVALVRRFRRQWWAPAGVAAIAAAVVVVYASPVVIDPLFNDFEPLERRELRADVLELADRAGVEVGGVYRVDASRRTTGANAYVGGLGETKRVVLYDNLLEELPPDQVRSVVAHELGHVANDDLRDGLAWVAIVALPAMLVVQRLTEAAMRGGRNRRHWPSGRPRPGEPVPGVPATVPAIALSLAVVAFCAQIPGNWLSRQVEARADAFALELTGQPAAFIGLQRSLGRRNLSEPDPPALVHALFGTHPTTLDRIGFALSWSRER